MNKLCDVFISYGRPDSLDFGRKLHARLLEQGFKVWFDQKDIPLGVDFQNEIDVGIERAHNFVFIIAPHSVNSDYCRKEIELAIKRNKRIIPLLHVEQISQETWQQRNPNGTPQEWEAYKAKGKHTVFQNMHPTIGKINWVYFREGIDDFEKSFTGLIDLFSRHADYVEQHTNFLVKALEWERHKKSHSCLLIGDDKQQAQDWLKRRFKDEQPPCVPSDLHCEYITESIKNANNLMTQVIICYADEDRATMEKIRNSLRRESITVWTNRTDIQTGEAFEEAIKRGIEQADNVVYLLSPDSVKSYFARKELEYAVSHNKRIIPVLVRETASEPIPNALRDLQYIDLTDNVKEDDYHLDESELLRILHQDAPYYNEHKVLLVKALKWKKQHNNPSILLRGYNLRSAEKWLKVAKNQRMQHLPTPLQEEFIEESLRQPPAESLDVFVSYSRADSDFARKLNDALQMQGKTTWFDQESIASGSDFQQEIYRGIKACGNFLFILSPRSVKSPYCADEVEYAASLNKRFVTVLHREVNSADLHPELRKVQWIDFNQQERNFDASFTLLVRTLDDDREHVHSHTKWLQRAIEWDSKNKSADLLLRGSEFAIAQNWLQETEQQKKQPAATPLQKEFILESGKAIATALKKEKRQVIILRSLLGVMSVTLVAVAGLGWQAYRQEKQAKQLLKGQVNALTRYSQALIESNQEFDALIEGIRAGTQLLEQPGKRKFTSKERVKEVLRAALNEYKEFNRLGERNTTVSVSPDNETIATASKDGAVQLWNFHGKTFKTLPHKGEVTNLFFSPDDGKTIATLSEDKTVKLWNKDGKELGRVPEQAVLSVGFSPDGKLIATYSGDWNHNTVKLWKRDGEKLNRFNSFPSGEKFNYLTFSDDGKLIATYSDDEENRTAKLWRLNGEKLNHFYSFPSSEKFDYLNLSRNGKLIATNNWSGDNTGKLWSIEGKQLKRLLSNEKFDGLEFSRDSKLIATYSGYGNNRTYKLWSVEGKQLKPLFPNETFNYLEFSRDSKLIATFSGDRDNKTVKLWNINSKEPKILSRNAENGKVWFSSDNKIIATANRDNTVQLWNQNGDELQTLHPRTSVDSVHFSSGADALATVSSDNKVKLWSFDSRERRVLSDADTPVDHVSFSPDGKLIASYSGSENNRIINLRSIEGKQLNRLLPSETFDYLVLGLDGKLIATYSSGGNKMGKLWSVEGKQLKRLLPNEKFDSPYFSPNGKLVATYSNDGNNSTVKLWSLEGKQLKRFLPNETFNDVSFSNSSGKLVSIYSKDGNNSTVKLWSADGKQLHYFTVKKQFDRLDLSPDGRLIATHEWSGSNWTAKLWSVDGKPIELFPPNEKINGLRFSPDGKLIATFSGDWGNTKVKFWKLEDKKPRNLLTVSMVPGPVEFSPDNKTIAAAVGNNSVKLWSQDGKELATLKLNGSIADLSFSPDGKILAIATADNKVTVWHLNLDQWMSQSQKELEELVEQACQKVGNYLKNSAPESDRTLCDGISKK